MTQAPTNDRMPSGDPARGTAEHARLAEATGRAEEALSSANPWYEWGPYLSERAWGTVREDYSADGEAWNYFPHDHARSRAYRWNEDGMAGLSDIGHELCLSLALWNGVDPILKERMFGLTGPQGNHGEDVKEYWWYLDALPSHAWLRWRYHYPQTAFPYQRLIDENARRSRTDPEFELLDTGAFDDGRYWLVEVAYAKASPTEVLVEISVTNQAAEPASLSVLPTLWFRNTWRPTGAEPPELTFGGDAIVVDHQRLGGYRLEAAATADGTLPQPLFCDNETNTARLFGSAPITPYPKDGINDHVVGGAATVNPDRRGTKACWRYDLTVAAHGTAELRLRLHRPEPDVVPAEWSGQAFSDVMAARRREADEFYTALGGPDLDDERARVLRQSCAGLVWSKQIYPYQVRTWLDGDPAAPPPPAGHRTGRNAGWRHIDAFDVLAMPDPWEYPWFAAWDLAFHTIPWAHLDPAFAKYQLIVLLREWFQHPNGALPAYEWSFDDVNPPVHALAALRVFMIDGGTDFDFLERVFQKLLLNFTWWLNRLDPDGNNLFGGGFLGLDNISPLDRSHLPPGYRLDQADGTAWMAYYSIAMLTLAVTLAERDSVYDDMVIKFAEQAVLIMDALHDTGFYDADDGFFYDRLTDPTGNAEPIKVQTLVGVIPALPAISVNAHAMARLQRLRKRFASRLQQDRPIMGWRIHGTGAPTTDAAVGGPARSARAHLRDLVRRAGLPVSARIALGVAATLGPLPGAQPARSDDRLRACGVDHRHVRRQLQLARTGLVPGQLSDHPRARPVRPVLRSRVHRRVPDRLGTSVVPAGGRRRPVRTADRDLVARTGRTQTGVRWGRDAADRPGVEGQPAVPRVLPRRQRSRPRCDAPDRLDGTGRGPDPRSAASAPTAHLRRALTRARTMSPGRCSARRRRTPDRGSTRGSGPEQPAP